MIITIFDNFFLKSQTLQEWFPEIQVEVSSSKHQKLSYLQQCKSDIVLLSEPIALETKKNLPYLLAISPSSLNPNIDWVSSTLPLSEIQKRLELIIKFLKEKKKVKIYEENFHPFFNWAVVGKIAIGTVHELNNPLQVMLGFVEEIEDRMAERIEYQEEVSLLKEEIYHCCDIVKNLQFSNDLQTNEYQDIEILLENILSLVQYQIHRKKISIEKQLTGNVAYIYGNSRIKTILLAIFTEVLENTKTKEKVSLVIQHSEDHIILKIQFTSLSEKIFHLFPFFMEKLLQETSVNFNHTSENLFHQYILEFPKIP